MYKFRIAGNFAGQQLRIQNIQVSISFLFLVLIDDTQVSRQRPEVGCIPIIDCTTLLMPAAQPYQG